MYGHPSGDVSPQGILNFLALLLMLLAGMTPALADGAALDERLFLLAGTPTNFAPATFPVSLYAVDTRERLKLIRRVAPPRAGLFLVREDLDVIYVTYPHITPTTVSVIHERRPKFDDDVTFNPRKLPVWYGGTGVSAGQGLHSYALFPLIQQTPRIHNGPLIRVADTASFGVSRVQTGELTDYERFRYAGCAGTPEGDPIPVAHVAGKYIVMDWGGRQIEMDRSAPSLGGEATSQPAAIFAATSRFFVFGLTHTRSNLSAPMRLYVHDRTLDLWKEIKFNASAPCSRLFGSWLATTVMMAKASPGEDENPGHEDERNTWVALALPNVRDAYATYMGARFYIPGKLILDNLIDGRRITFKTNEEDSEILYVRSGGLVLYRVNDEIFSAHIEGDKLGPAKLVVKGEDVPEIHWAFWSNAEGKAEAKPKTSQAAQPPGGR